MDVHDQGSVSSKSNNQFSRSKHTCSICGDKGAAKHYGAYSCESCKSFFKRTVRKGLTYVCLKEEHCKIDKRHPDRCPCCRYRKCLRHGMKPEAVQEDRHKSSSKLSHKAESTNKSHNGLSINKNVHEPALNNFDASDDQFDNVIKCAKRLVDDTNSDEGKSKKSKLNEFKRSKHEKKKEDNLKKEGKKLKESKKIKEDKNSNELQKVEELIDREMRGVEVKSEPKENERSRFSSVNHKIELFSHSVHMESVDRKEKAEAKKAKEANDKIIMGSKVKTRSKVFSGTARNVCYTRVPTLEELCLNRLIDNHDKILYLGNAPYYLVKPVLAKCSPLHLLELEYYNPYLTEDDDELWEWHCQREFKGWERDDDESWRELYSRAEQETRRKLLRVTQEIKFKERSKVPTRKTKLAFVDTVPKPPKSIRKLQDKFQPTPAAVANPGSVKALLTSTMTLPAAPNKKPAKKAPLMQNCLKLMKSMRR